MLDDILDGKIVCQGSNKNLSFYFCVMLNLLTVEIEVKNMIKTFICYTFVNNCQYNNNCNII